MLTRRRARRHTAQGKAECALRVVAGEHEGLSSHWRHGIATFAKGRIELRPYVWQLRLLRPRAKPVDIDVVSIDPHDRRSEFRELWSLDAGTRVMTIATPTATLLWAVSPLQAEWALSRIK